MFQVNEAMTEIINLRFQMRSAASTIAIIGAGFTGTLLAVHLLRQARTPLAIDLIEKRGGFGGGLAYSTGNASHLLNVRAMNMSAFPDEPRHFVDWLSRREDSRAPVGLIPPSGHAFVPRGLYGTYLAEQLDDAINRASPGVTCRMRDDTAIDLTRDGHGFVLRLETGETMAVNRVALCLGNFPPQLPGVELSADAEPPQFIADPWAGDILAKVPRAASVLILGTGLTMVDVVLSLLDQGHSGQITALSRRGLLPQRHAEVRPYEDFLAHRRILPATTLGILRVLRAEVRGATVQGHDWRSVVDAVRPYLPHLWGGLPLAERRRFLRHARPYWEIHRHRMAPNVAGRITAARERGQLTFHAGRLKTVARDGSRVLTTYSPRGTDSRARIETDILINCAGPESNFALIKDPLVRALLDRGLIRPDPLGLGIETTLESEVIAADGTRLENLLALGPIARGNFWEMTAVPELRCLCAVVGKRLASAGGAEAADSTTAAGAR